MYRPGVAVWLEPWALRNSCDTHVTLSRVLDRHKVRYNGMICDVARVMKTALWGSISGVSY